MSALENVAVAEVTAAVFLQQTQALAINFFFLFEFRIFIAETKLDYSWASRILQATIDLLLDQNRGKRRWKTKSQSAVSQ